MISQPIVEMQNFASLHDDYFHSEWEYFKIKNGERKGGEAKVRFFEYINTYIVKWSHYSWQLYNILLGKEKATMPKVIQISQNWAG